jgi:hypothetical protein
VAKISREKLDKIWLVTDAFILLTDHDITNLSVVCFLCTHTALLEKLLSA